MKFSNSPFLQNLVYVVILLIVGSIFYWLRPTYIYGPHGIFLPSESPAFPPSPTMNIQWTNDFPEGAEPLGDISVMTHFDSTDPAEIEAILTNQKEFVQTLAAARGADGVEILISGRSPGAPNPLDGVISKLKAFKTRPR